MGRRKLRVPLESFDNSILADKERRYPSIECLTPKELETVEERTGKLIQFESKARTPSRVISFLDDLFSESRFEGHTLHDSSPSSRQKKYFFRDK